MERAIFLRNPNKLHLLPRHYSLRNFFSLFSSSSKLARSSSFTRRILHRPIIPLTPRSLLLPRRCRFLPPSDTTYSSSFHFNKHHFSSASPHAIATQCSPGVSTLPDEVAAKYGFEKVSEEFIGEKDSTGIPHILEHSVLCGSRKYALKEPFVELLKGSLHTFLNAFTYPDRTCYPVASTNTKDFYNLVDVYLDAVFFPKCVEDHHTFQQEGWHFELNNPSEEISYKGVVFNEMKGVYSQPDNILGRTAQLASSLFSNCLILLISALFPDNTYGVDSGGDPKVIPKLTFEQFKEFHGKYYHPSNARIWFYGDDDPTERLRILSEYLDMFDASSASNESRIEQQKFFSEPVRIVEKYPAGDGSDLKKKHMWSWRCHCW
ncbi:PRESEQUENCE PROTEASE [Salix koriyanagi]|uniref:PRESEQUENCE PROTEASE n=1 Tax=Salix koriyanagi TaxID=2511006 RepID=A0A9Q0TRT5_9ROSI|nr:PRESEQUENCE PROTEASE [Salix koriyanagi]